MHFHDAFYKLLRSTSRHIRLANRTPLEGLQEEREDVSLSGSFLSPVSCWARAKWKSPSLSGILASSEVATQDTRYIGVIFFIQRSNLFRSWWMVFSKIIRAALLIRSKKECLYTAELLLKKEKSEETRGAGRHRSCMRHLYLVSSMQEKGRKDNQKLYWARKRKVNNVAFKSVLHHHEPHHGSPGSSATDKELWKMQC